MKTSLEPSGLYLGEYVSWKLGRAAAPPAVVDTGVEAAWPGEPGGGVPEGG